MRSSRSGIPSEEDVRLNRHTRDMGNLLCSDKETLGNTERSVNKKQTLIGLFFLCYATSFSGAVSSVSFTGVLVTFTSVLNRASFTRIFPSRSLRGFPSGPLS